MRLEFLSPLRTKSCTFCQSTKSTILIIKMKIAVSLFIITQLIQESTRIEFFLLQPLCMRSRFLTKFCPASKILCHMCCFISFLENFIFSTIPALGKICCVVLFCYYTYLKNPFLIHGNHKIPKLASGSSAISSRFT